MFLRNYFDIGFIMAEAGRYFSKIKPAGSQSVVSPKPKGAEVEDLTQTAQVEVFKPKFRESGITAIETKEDVKDRNKLLSSIKSKGKRFEGKPHRKIHRQKEKETDEPVPIPEEKLDKYYRDEPVRAKAVKTRFAKKVVKQQNESYENARRFTAKSELMLTEEAGYAQVEEDDLGTAGMSQKQILKQVDVITQQKYFDIKLDKFGPYRISYTRNGRYLALAGAYGHVACFDWVPKRLMCEVHVKERCRDICFLHQETMFAVAQKRLYIYDNQGIELHCVNQMPEVERLEFLPYHFLLVGAAANGFLTYLDVSVGNIVASFPTKEPSPTNVMCQNPTNAIIHLGHRTGTVTLWSPNVKESLMKILCHRTTLSSVTVDSTGNYMATSALDRRVSIWDLRNHSKKVASIKIPMGASSLDFSQRGLLATSWGQHVGVFESQKLIEIDDDVEVNEAAFAQPYLRHSVNGQVANVRFCPFEDVLGIGYNTGIASILVPGAGEPNFDAFEANPFMSKKQRREHEVRQLLDKIQPELIDLDPTKVIEVHRPSVIEREEKRKKLLLGKPDRLVVEPRMKVRGLPMSKRKRIFKEEKLQERNKKLAKQTEALDKEIAKQEKSERKEQESPKTGVDAVLRRFSKAKKV